MTPADEDEFSLFVAGRSRALLRTAYLLTGDAHAAEDLLQVALMRTLRHWNRIRDRESLDAFVRQVMVNEHRSRLRRRSSREVPSDDVALAADVPHHGDAAQVDDSIELARALASLTPRQRATVVLRFYEDLSEPEVARILRCSVGTVKSQTSRALARLRAVVAPPLSEGTSP